MNKHFDIDELYDLIAELNPKIDQSGKNYIIDCPSCGKRECSISLNEGHLWGCFRLKRCGETGNIWKMLKLLGKEFKTSNFIGNSRNIDTISIENLLGNSGSGIPSISLNFNIKDLPDIPIPFGFTRQLSGNQYLDNRGFKSYEYCEVGISTLDRSLRNYIIFIVRENSKVKGYVARHTWDKDRINEYNDKVINKSNLIKRYKNSYGTDFSSLLYGYDEIKDSEIKPCVLVEGIFDKLALDSKLELNKDRFLYTCATFKAFVSDVQIVKLLMKGIEDVILFYDPDVIGIIQKNVERLSKFFKVMIVISDNGKDPDEMSQGELIYQFYNNRYTVSQVMTDFVQVRGIGKLL